ncbi:hypothetical protein [Pseudoscardovia radai]|uniref:hypothetical protein n=1 Tax=Pseudoscardovia radai TaxID=987066 RepID=UPI003990FA2A
MSIDGGPRLCGGTFFVLVLQALKNRKGARAHYRGDRDGLSDPEVLIGLVKVINPDYEPPSLERLKTKTSQFKACKLSKGEYLPFSDAPEVEAFDERVRTDYRSALRSMTDFVDRFLDAGQSVHKDVALVKALIELVQADTTIASDEGFYICENGDTMTKGEFDGLVEVCYPAFLLGVLHYVVVYRKDNSVGRNTYDEWCPSSGGGPRNYSGSMGNGITTLIRTYMPEFAEGERLRDKNADEPIHDKSAGRESPVSQDAMVLQQVVNTPLFVQQNGNGNMILSNYGTLNLTIGGEE